MCSDFGLGLEALASASKLWPQPQPQPQSFGLSLKDLVVLLCNRAFFVQISCKIREFC